MIDATDHVGVPVITSCPSYATHDGKLYEIAADALVTRRSDIIADIVADFTEHATGRGVHDWQRGLLREWFTPRVTQPHLFVRG